MFAMNGGPLLVESVVAAIEMESLGLILLKLAVGLDLLME